MKTGGHIQPSSPPFVLLFTERVSICRQAQVTARTKVVSSPNSVHFVAYASHVSLRAAYGHARQFHALHKDAAAAAKIHRFTSCQLVLLFAAGVSALPLLFRRAAKHKSQLLYQR